MPKWGLYIFFKGREDYVSVAVIDVVGKGVPAVV